ncbi:MAG: hypothetical protein KAH72_03715 [Flavobacteriaceae bacterium]|nr:hypothetical protein [Flavobacteriaceae bacterium]
MTIRQKVSIFGFSVLAIGLIGNYYNSTEQLPKIKTDMVVKKIVSEKEKIMMQNKHVVKKIDTVKKDLIILKEKENIKLKPNHLYVRNKEQIQHDVQQRKQMQKRYWEQKRVRDNHMKNQQLKKHINKTKGKENV